MQFPNASGKRVNMTYAVDDTFWTKLMAFIDYEPASAIDPELRGVLASIGMIKGQPFNPNQKQQALLQKAVETAPKMILATRQLGRPDERDRYYKDRQYLNTWAAGTSEWLQDGYLDVNQRASYFQIAFSSASAMVMRTLGAGSKYPFTTRDANGEFLTGGNTYKLHQPPNPPAALFWAVTAYNITDGTGLWWKRHSCCHRSTASARSRRTAMGRSISGSVPRSPLRSPIRTSSRPSTGDTSWRQCDSTAPGSSSSTSRGSRTTL